MEIIETDYWCMFVPDEWAIVRDQDLIKMTDENEVGELILNTLIHQDGHLEFSKIYTLAETESPEVCDWMRVTLGKFAGITGEFQEFDTSIREWYVGYGSALLYITYACWQAHAGIDAALVDDILSTLVPGDEIEC